MKATKHPAHAIAAQELAELLAHREPITVLDVRDEVEGSIEAPGLSSRHVASSEVLADAGAVASGLSGRVAVVCNRGLTATPVAEALRGQGVDAVVLEGGMRGWIGALQSHPVELGLEGVAVRQVQRPGRGCLSYLLAADGSALVVDPAPDADYYLELAHGLGARITDVFDTHLHADHLSGARALGERTGARLRLPASALERGVADADRFLPVSDGETIDIGPLRLRAIALPGHTTDMTGLVLDGHALIAGDSLFVDGIARPDLQRSDPDGARAMARVLHRTLHERVLSLGEDVLLLPCHTHPGVAPEAVFAPLSEVAANVPELSIGDPEQFAAAVVADMPPRPANYETIIAVNAGTHPFDPELESGGNSCSSR